MIEMAEVWGTEGGKLTNEADKKYIHGTHPMLVQASDLDIPRLPGIVARYLVMPSQYMACNWACNIITTRWMDIRCVRGNASDTFGTYETCAHIETKPEL